MTYTSELRRVAHRARYLFRGRLACYDVALSIVGGRAGLEIGGPSDVFRGRFSPCPIYSVVKSLDNCNFSSKTVWATHPENYGPDGHQTLGKTIIADATDLSSLADNSYDFVLSSHNLEHVANPVKALKEWQRITRPGGGLILVLPHNKAGFDHRRQPTEVDHMFDDFNQDIGENDLTHLPEIVRLHDLAMDPAAGTIESFRLRGLDNLHARCLHHHVFNESNSKELLTRIGITILAVETTWAGHIFLIARMT